MSAQIHVKPDDVWSFFNRNKARLSEEMVAIAQNEETNYIIYITEDASAPLFSVCRDEEEMHCESVLTEINCSQVVKRLYLKYLFPISVTMDTEFPPDELYDDPLIAQDMEDEIYEREDELNCAALDFLEVLLGYRDIDEISVVHGEDFVECFIEDVCKCLSKRDIYIYRPMVLIDEETGQEYVEEFPYMCFEDEDNSVSDLDTATP